MFKKLSAMLLAVTMMTAAGAGFAQSSDPVTYTVRATVPAVLSLGGWLLEVDSTNTASGTVTEFGTFLDTVPTAIDFGTLDVDPDGWNIYRPHLGHYYIVNLIASTSARPYTIQHQMGSTGNTDVDAAMTVAAIFSPDFVMKITYPNGDEEEITNADMGFDEETPPGVLLEGKYHAVGTRDIYTSSSAGESLIIGEAWGLFDGDKDTDGNDTLDYPASPLVVGAASMEPANTTVTYVATLNG